MKFRTFRAKLHHHYIFGLSIIAIVVLAIGLGSTYYYFDQSPKTSSTNYNGLSIDSSNSTQVNDTEFIIDIETVTSNFQFTLSFVSLFTGHYYFLVIFPFPLKANASNLESIPKSNYSSVTHDINDSSSVIMVSCQTKYTGHQEIVFQGESSVSFLSGIRGSDNFYFPSGISAPSPAFTQAALIYGQDFIVPLNYGLQIIVGIPGNSVSASAYPGTAFSYTSPLSADHWFSWSFSSLQDVQPVSINFMRESESSFFEFTLFLGGVLVGLGTSLATEAFFEWAKNQLRVENL